MRKSKLMQMFLLSTVIGLSACKSGDGSDPASDIGDGAGAVIGGGTDIATDFSDALGGWFVTEFDMDLVRAVRRTTSFAAQNLNYRLSLEDHPVFDGSQTVQSNPLREIGVDYARSVGLTGAGVKIAVIDSRILDSHEDFNGKSIEVATGPLTGYDEHGTAVAGAAAGAGGVAPAAEIFSGVLDYDDDVDFNLYASLANQAQNAGALVMNNSWTIGGSINDSRALLTASGRNYLSALRNFSKDGVVIFAASNGYDDANAHLLAALPALHPDLEENWLAVINAIPTMEDDNVASAIRVSAGCMEAAAWCLAANGQMKLPTYEGSTSKTDSYKILGGASFAAPQVAGSLALLAEAFPNLTSDQLRARLLVTADNGFFTPDDHIDFGGGLSHGYNAEFGHGFVDLKSALLPIGTIAMPTAAGQNRDLAEMTIMSSGAAGDAMARSLANEVMVISDQMNGSFELPASSIVATASPDDEIAISSRLTRLNSSAVLQARNLAAAGDVDLALALPESMVFEQSHSIGAANSIPLSGGQDFSLNAILSEEADGGIAISGARSFSSGGAGFEIGFEAARERDAILGVRGTGRNGGSEHLALTLGAAVPVAPGALLRIDGSVGRASGGRISEFAQLGDQKFNSFGASLSMASAAVDGDVLTFFARQPIAVSSGTAEVEITRPMASALGGMDFTPVTVDLAPSARQFDIGFEYLRPVGTSSDMALVFRHSDNHANLAGERNTELGISFSTSF